MLTRMSTDMGFAELPDWDVADRLAKSLRHSRLKVQDMAEYLGVHRNTVGAWINGRTPVDERTLKLWAQRTGWPLEWLRDGMYSPTPPPPAHPYRAPQESGAPARISQLRRTSAGGGAGIAGRAGRSLVGVSTDDDPDDDAIAYLRLADDDGQPNTSTVGGLIQPYRPAQAA